MTTDLMTDPTPPDNAVYLDVDHAMVPAAWCGDTAGITEWHRKRDGTWCQGWVAFNGSQWALAFKGNPAFQGWDVVQWEPLTLSPSIQCRACGSHGHITNGKWVPSP